MSPPSYPLLVKVISDLHYYYGNEIINFYLKGDPLPIIRDFNDWKPGVMLDFLIKLSLLLMDLEAGNVEFFHSESANLLPEWQRLFIEFFENQEAKP